MPVSGLVVSLSDQDDLREQAVAAIRAEERIEVGPIAARRMAVVVDTTTTEEDKELWNWLNNLPGVVFVDVTMVGYEQDSQHPSGDGDKNAANTPAKGLV